MTIAQFYRILELGSEGRNRNGSTMRFVKPYNPVVIDLISRSLLHDTGKLHVLIYFYATSK